METSIKVDITLELLKLKLSQSVFERLAILLANNFMLEDVYTEDFNQAIKTQVNKEPKSQKQPLTVDVDNRHLNLQLRASCLSLELREDGGKLIGEACMVGFLI